MSWTVSNYTPLHTLYTFRSGMTSLVQFLARTIPRFVSSLDCGGRTPLHLICCGYNVKAVREVVLPTVQFLTDARPETLMSKDHLGYTILDCVCMASEFAEVIRFLAERCPTAAESNDGRRSPFHLLLYRGAGWLDANFVSALALSEAAVSGRDAYGHTPLHIMCIRGRSPELLAILVDACPHLPRVRDNEGKTPLHKAIEEFSKYHERPDAEKVRASRKVIHFLILKCPESAHIEDKNGLTPLGMASEMGASLSVIFELVSFNPVLMLGLS